VGHSVATVSYMGWNGSTNGALLSEAAAAGFEVLVTVDRAIEDQHNLDDLPISIVVIAASENTVQVLRPLIPGILGVLKQLQPKSFLVLKDDSSTI
jgi:hypothetical protein